MNRKQIPNIVTILRILLVFPIVGFLYCEQFTAAFYLFILSGLSDGIDGFLARRYNWFTRFGSIADPLADKFLMISTVLMLTYVGKIPLWLLIVIVVRDVIIISGGLAYHFIIGRFELAPSLLSKLNTVLQLLLIVLVLFQSSYHILADSLIQSLIYLVLIMNVASLIHYIIIWSTRAYRNAHIK